MKKTASGQTDEKLTANEAGGQDRNERKLFWLKAFGNIEDQYIEAAASAMTQDVQDQNTHEHSVPEQNVHKQKDGDDNTLKNTRARKSGSKTHRFSRLTTVLATAAAAIALLFVARQVMRFVPVVGEDRPMSAAEQSAPAEAAGEMPETYSSEMVVAEEAAAAEDIEEAEEAATADGIAEAEEAVEIAEAKEAAENINYTGEAAAEAAEEAPDSTPAEAEAPEEFEEAEEAMEAPASSAGTDTAAAVAWEGAVQTSVTGYDEAEQVSDAADQMEEEIISPSASEMTALLSSHGLESDIRSREMQTSPDGLVQIRYLDKDGNTIVTLTRTAADAGTAQASQEKQSERAGSKAGKAGSMNTDDAGRDADNTEADHTVQWDQGEFHYSADFGSLSVTGQIADELRNAFR